MCLLSRIELNSVHSVSCSLGDGLHFHSLVWPARRGKYLSVFTVLLFFYCATVLTVLCLLFDKGDFAENLHAVLFDVK